MILKYRIVWFIVYLLWVLLPCKGKAQIPWEPSDEPKEVLDSVISNLLSFAPLYENIIHEYRADLYIKGKMNVHKRNQIIWMVPNMFRMQKGVNEYMLESFSELHFTAPHIYDQKVVATVGTIPESSGFDEKTLEYFHTNIYASSLMRNKLLSPLAANARKYYTYRLDSVYYGGEYPLYKIRFIPRNESYQLVRGHMVVSGEVWSVREIYFSGKSEIIQFTNYMRMGAAGDENELLPVEHDVNAMLRFMGNVVEGNYHAQLDYKEIEMQQLVLLDKEPRVYDLTESYNLQCDTSSFYADSVYFETIRPIPLTEEEYVLYGEHALRRDTIEQSKDPKKRNQVLWGQVGDVLLSSYTIRMENVGDVRCSPLINPFLLSYSGKYGLSYRQEFKYNRLFPGDKLLRIVPKIGYNFTDGEFFWSVRSDYEYWPSKRAGIHMDFGNGNRIYSTDVLDEIKNTPDSMFDLDKIHLDYFHDLYFKLRHSYEITNGLNVSVSFSTHRRKAVKASVFVTEDPENPVGEAEESPYERYRQKYVSFAPNIRVEWTPGQYYYRHGARKVNLHSHFPTFSVDWERGIKGVFTSTSQYEWIEFDMQHQIPLGLMRTFYYRLGGGIFTNKKQLYFVDFNNFRRNSLPVGWNDDIGGTFQLLDTRWFNSLDKYVRANFAYESPFIFMRQLRKYTRYVLNERVYLNTLVVPHLKPYMEFGYGIGTHIFDLGFFVSAANWKYFEVGFKITFELFNR